MTGRERLENWANWARIDNPRLGYPKICAHAREYQAEAGDIWIEPSETITIDDIDAGRVEAFVVALQAKEREIVRMFHVERYLVMQIARAFSASSRTITEILDSVENRVGVMI
jgi:DNA-directed RNA polymerase specialized sigma24 family protein